jgi:hypothetical protein
MEVTKKKSGIRLDGFKVYLDCEWTSENIPVSVQVLLTHRDGFEKRYIVINKLYELNLQKKIVENWMALNNTNVVYYPLDYQFNVIHTLLTDFYLQKVEGLNEQDYYYSGEVYMFYSFQDLGFAFGWKNVEDPLKKELNSKRIQKMEQKRSITGVLKINDDTTCRQNSWKVKDLSGLTNTSLKRLASLEKQTIRDNVIAESDRFVQLC